MVITLKLVVSAFFENSKILETLSPIAIFLKCPKWRGLFVFGEGNSIIILSFSFPLPNFSLAKYWRKEKVTFKEKERSFSLPYFKPKNIFEQIY